MNVQTPMMADVLGPFETLGREPERFAELRQSDPNLLEYRVIYATRHAVYGGMSAGEFVRARRQALRSTMFGHRKISDDDVLAIRQAAQDADTKNAELAEKFGVHPSHISRIIHGRAWPEGPGSELTFSLPERRGRSLRKLTPQQVRRVRMMRENGVLLRVLARQFGIDEAAIHRIVNRVTYKDVA